MTGGAYAEGVALLLVGAAPLVVGAVRLRRRLVPDCTGALAALATATIAIGMVTATCQVLGAVGAFRRIPLVLACVAVGAVAAIAGRSAPAAPAAIRERQRPSAHSVVALAVVAVLSGQWAARIIASYREGILDFDSLWYHLPFAARFAQEGWITRLPLVTPDFPTMFHPANSELLHGFGMSVVGTDVISPLLNLGWLALGLLAGWCAGRPWGLGAAAMVGTAAVFALPEVAATQSGSGGNDAAVVALVATVAAFLLQPEGGRGARLLAGLAAGLALGTKLTLLAALGILSVGVVICAARGARRAAFLQWTLPMAALGGVWYVRNLVRVGSPVPSIPLGVGDWTLPSPSLAIVEERGFSVAHYLTDVAVWREWFLPGLDTAFGTAWWAVLGVAVVGVAAAVISRSSLPAHRVLGVAGAVSALAYLVMPTSAMGPEGRPVLFYLTLRYVIPSLWLGIMLFVVGPVGRRFPAAVLAGLTAIFAVTQLAGGVLGAWPGDHRRPAALVALAVAGVGAALVLLRPSRRVVTAAALLAVVGVGLLGFPVQRAYFRDRYQLEPYSWARTVRDTRIGFAGFEEHYPLYGDDLSNVVQYVGRRGPHSDFDHIGSCAEWRQALRAGRYAYAVVLPTPSYTSYTPLPERQVTWTREDPAASVVEELADGAGAIFELRAGAGSSPCR